jgi:hypothetical protein
MLLKGIDDIIDDVMECKPKTLVPNIDDHIFIKEYKHDVDMGKDNDDMNAMNGETDGERLLLVRPCLVDLVDHGWKKLDHMKIRKVQMVANKQSQRKQQTTCYIMDRVMVMKAQTMSTTIPSELDVTEDSE